MSRRRKNQAPTEGQIRKAYEAVEGEIRHDELPTVLQVCYELAETGAWGLGSFGALRDEDDEEWYEKVREACDRDYVEAVLRGLALPFVDDGLTVSGAPGDEGEPSPAVAEPPASDDLARAVERVTQHRRGLGLPPIDFQASGWTEDDILAEAERIRRPNPLLASLMPPGRKAHG